KLGGSKSTTKSTSLVAFCRPFAWEPNRPILRTPNLRNVSFSERSTAKISCVDHFFFFIVAAFKVARTRRSLSRADQRGRTGGGACSCTRTCVAEYDLDGWNGSDLIDP